MRNVTARLQMRVGAKKLVLVWTFGLICWWRGFFFFANWTSLWTESCLCNISLNQTQLFIWFTFGIFFSNNNNHLMYWHSVIISLYEASPHPPAGFRLHRTTTADESIKRKLTRNYFDYWWTVSSKTFFWFQILKSVNLLFCLWIRAATISRLVANF